MTETPTRASRSKSQSRGRMTETMSRKPCQDGESLGQSDKISRAQLHEDSPALRDPATPLPPVAPLVPTTTFRPPLSHQEQARTGAQVTWDTGEPAQRVESPHDDRAPSPKNLEVISALVPKWELGGRRKRKSTWSSSLASSTTSQETGAVVLRNTAQEVVNINAGEPQNWETFSERQHEYTTYVGAWVSRLEDSPEVDMSLVKYRGGELQDFDTFTGSYAGVLDYPVTIKDLSDVVLNQDQELNWRADNMTAALEIKQLAHRRYEVAVMRENARLQEKQRGFARDPEPETQPWPTAECLIRPAEQDDLAAVAAIMNRERDDKTSPQVIEERNITADDLLLVLRECLCESRPFVVAETPKDILLDRSQWPKQAEAAYREYVQFRKTQPHPETRIMGFAFVTEARRAMSGRPCHGSRHSGHVKILVDRQYQGKLVGSALMDRILTSVCRQHHSVVDYEWQCDDPRGVYHEPSIQNHRQYAWVELTSYRPSGNKVMARQERFAEKFDFKRTQRFDKEVKLDRGYGSSWLDMEVWRKDVEQRSSMHDIGRSVGEDPPQALRERNSPGKGSGKSRKRREKRVKALC